MAGHTTDLQLNPALDVLAAARRYQEIGVVQIPAVFENSSAAAISDILTRSTPWRLTFLENGKPMSYAPDGVQQLGREAFQQKLNAVMTEARSGSGYCFSAYPMSQARAQGWDEGHPLHQVTDFLNQKAFLDVARAVTGQQGLNRTEAMATLYAPGQFLTRHIDHGANNERRAAYVLGFSQEWRAEWGGLLLFHDEKGDVTGGFTPRFNVITIFDVKYEHAVTQVANFAGSGRYSISGWFRDDTSGAGDEYR